MSQLIELAASKGSPSEERLLLREFAHRISNEFASAIGVISLAAARSANDEVKVALAAAQDRLQNYAQVHQALRMPEHGSLVDAGAYLHQLCRAISRSRLDVKNIELVLVERPLRMNSDRCWRLGMIVSELITNAARHAFRESGGVIRVEVRLSQSFVECRITDNGKAAANIRPGRGLEIVEALAKGLHGKIDQQFGPQGATTVVIFPILRGVFQSCGTPLERFNNLRLPDADASAQTMPDASLAKRHLAHQRSPVEVDPAFRRDVLKGLDIRPRAIPARWFYDRRGSELFEAITALPEYYPTRVERSILSSAVTEIAALTGPARAIVELGSGSSAKTSILLSEIIPSAYVPIDISGAFLRESATTLSQRFPNLPIYPLEGDFTGTLALPEAIEGMPRLGFFPGSTIGNLGVPAAVDLLRVIAATLGPGSMLLIGIDRIKDTSILLPAYDDAQGVTAAFNLNLLHRINRELMGSVPVDAFRHRVQWNDAEARIEMHLEATRDVRFGVAGRTFSMAEGETIHTENSFKYGLRAARMLLRAGGWAPIADWTDQNGFFSLILTKEGAASSVP